MSADYRVRFYARAAALLFAGPLAAAYLIGTRVHDHRHPHTKGHR